MFPLELAYGQWGNLAGYIYGTAVHYTLNPPDNRTPEQIKEKLKEMKEEEEENEDDTEKSTDTATDDHGDLNEEDEENQPHDSAD